MINNKHRNLILRLLLVAPVGAFALPTVGSAAPLASAAPLEIDEPQPIALDDDDPPCEQTVIALEVDVSTGEVFLVDATGGLTLTDNEINIYFGALTTVLIDIEYSASEWDVDVTPDGQPTESYLTRGGSLRYWIDDSVSEYVFSSTEWTGASTMTPVIPDIILTPIDDCLPPA